jgi:hypothetical protein
MKEDKIRQAIRYSFTKPEWKVPRGRPKYLWEDNIVTWRLKAGIVKPERKSIASQRLAKHVPAATNKHGIWTLVGNGSVSTFALQRISTKKKQNNRGTVRHGDLYSVRLEVSSVQESSVARDSSFAIRHSRREDTRSPVRNGASLRQPLIVCCYNWL